MSYYECIDDKYIDSSSLNSGTPLYDKCNTSSNNTGHIGDNIEKHLSNKSNYDAFYTYDGSGSFNIDDGKNVPTEDKECVDFQKYVKCQLAACNRYEFKLEDVYQYIMLIALIVLGGSMFVENKKKYFKGILFIILLPIVIVVGLINVGVSAGIGIAILIIPLIIFMLIEMYKKIKTSSKDGPSTDYTPYLFLGIFSIYLVSLYMGKMRVETSPDFADLLKKSTFERIYESSSYLVGFVILFLTMFVQSTLLDSRKSRPGTEIMQPIMAIILFMLLYTTIGTGTYAIFNESETEAKSWFNTFKPSIIMALITSLFVGSGYGASKAFDKPVLNQIGIVLAALVNIFMFRVYPTMFKVQPKYENDENFTSNDYDNVWTTIITPNIVAIIILAVFIFAKVSNKANVLIPSLLMLLTLGSFIAYIAQYHGSGKEYVNKLFQFSNQTCVHNFVTAIIVLLFTTIYSRHNKKKRSDNEDNTSYEFILMLSMMSLSAITMGSLMLLYNYPDQFVLTMVGQKAFFGKMVGSSLWSLPLMPILIYILRDTGYVELAVGLRGKDLGLQLHA
jgi:hypothetical protein